MKIVIDIPEKTYQKIIAGTYDYGDMNVIIQNGTQYEERPHGEWICKGAVGDGTWCSSCDAHFSIFPNRYNFCPNCGADMREGEANE